MEPLLFNEVSSKYLQRFMGEMFITILKMAQCGQTRFERED